LSVRLDRTGIFRAKILQWGVREADSGAVGVEMEFVVTAQLDGSEWVSWAEADEHTVWGTWWVITKGGKPNQTAVDQLVECLGWNGALELDSLPPAAEVQISVKAEEYNGQTRLKATWMNPRDYVPPERGPAPEEVRKLQGRFGSLLRAAASGAARNAAKPATPAPAARTAAPPARSSAPARRSPAGGARGAAASAGPAPPAGGTYNPISNAYDPAEPDDITF